MRRSDFSQESHSFEAHDEGVREPATSTDELRVLVVDDEINIAELLLMALRYEGFAAETAEAARRLLRGSTTFART